MTRVMFIVRGQLSKNLIAQLTLLRGRECRDSKGIAANRSSHRVLLIVTSQVIDLHNVRPV